MDIVLYLALGCVGGFLAGLFGIGGGLIIVPTLVWVFRHQGYDMSVAMHMALATSLATIVVTGISSARAHHQQHHVHWPTAKALTPFLVLGSVSGVVVAHFLTGQLLGRLFVGFLILMSVYMWFSPEPKQHRFRVANWRWKFASTLMGVLSALLGIGGALFMVPFLKSKGMAIRYAIGTAAFCGVPLAVTGTIGYMLGGGAEQPLPVYTIGYVNLLAFACIVLTSSHFSKVGAKLVTKVPPQRMRRGFAVFIWVLAANLIYKMASN
ncbi:sulfite exporter TauE/SafE family protein [Echinimonas agarilytica]|uniref:Probable membrane transporter protein n=1 Tax=Echinimonas agarilytica TaxID=1215918 RepID=A0AA41W8W4_9GAMM|nr:sulfite exporter TauE/SafE family protein [Echinimonas agarilytica]MCM2681275.1 sulfite exporter TauE/SafE family protein [Echinimonas agarilytica]